MVAKTGGDPGKSVRTVGGRTGRTIQGSGTVFNGTNGNKYQGAKYVQSGYPSTTKQKSRIVK